MRTFLADCKTHMLFIGEMETPGSCRWTKTPPSGSRCYCKTSWLHPGTSFGLLAVVTWVVCWPQWVVFSNCVIVVGTVSLVVMWIRCGFRSSCRRWVLLISRGICGRWSFILRWSSFSRTRFRITLSCRSYGRGSRFFSCRWAIFDHPLDLE